MQKIEKKDIPTLAILSIFAIISFLIIKNFIVILAFTLILTYMYQPTYTKINRILKSHALTSIISIALLLILIIAPTIFAINEFSKEISAIETSSIDPIDNVCQQIGIDLPQEYSSIINGLNISTREILYSEIPRFIFHIALIIFFFYYFLKHYQTGRDQIKKLLPLETFNKWEEKIKTLLNGIIYGQILTRLIQAITATILFLLIQIDAAILWGALTFFAAFIPIIGTALIWAPLIILSLLQENYITSALLLGSGIIISTIDNFLLPYFISERTKIGPITTLISILGGLQLFGIYGLILGPFSLGIFLVTLKEFAIRIRKRYPKMKRYIWKDSEREKYRNLKTEEGKKRFVELLSKKYEKRK